MGSPWSLGIIAVGASVLLGSGAKSAESVPTAPLPRAAAIATTQVWSPPQRDYVTESKGVAFNQGYEPLGASLQHSAGSATESGTKLHSGIEARAEWERCEDLGCVLPAWRHRTSLFGELLYLRARNAEVPFASPIDGPIAPGGPPIQVGPTALVDPDYEPAFRVGFNYALTNCGSLQATYSHFESQTSDAVTVDAPNVVRALVLHPLSAAAAAADGLDAEADYGIDFELVDADFRAILVEDERYAINYILGARYAHLEQDFASTFSVLGTTNARTNIGFDGGGIRLGLDGERHSCNSGLFIFGRSTANFVAGDFRANFFQSSTGAGTEVETSWKAGRIVSMLDVEFGTGWQTEAGNLRFSAGYQVSAWFNTVTTGDYIRAVQSNTFEDLGDTVTFDGLTARVEVKF